MWDLRDVAIIFSTELGRSVRSGKTFALLALYGLAAALASLVVVGLTRTAPLLLPFFVRFALFFMPPLVAVMGFDQLAGELQHRSLRYVALRARRGAIVAGKALAQLALVMALTATVHLALFAWAVATSADFDAAAAVGEMLAFWGVALVYAFCFVGLTALASSLFRAPIVALIATLCAIFGFWFVDVLARFVEALAPVAKLSPSHYTAGLVGAPAAQLVTSLLAFVAFGAVFLGGAWLSLRLRDL
ncbi:MAG: ABC transporter permease [Myxococcales bacterium]